VFGARGGWGSKRAAQPVSSLVVSGAEGRLGWSAMPRIAVWLCVPALLTGIAGATVWSTAAILSDQVALRRPIVQAAAAEGVVFVLPSLGLTPVASVLAGVITLRKKWSASVVWTVWVVVLVSLAVVIPAGNLALANYAYSTPRPAEAPLDRE
jgi:hypothetical protein